MKNMFGVQCYTKDAKERWVFEQVLENKHDTFYGEISLGNGTQFKIGCFWVNEGPQKGRLFLGIEYLSSYTFSANTFPSYAAEKLKLPESDAKAMADFINAQFDNPNELFFGGPEEERYI